MPADFAVKVICYGYGRAAYGSVNSNVPTCFVVRQFARSTLLGGGVRVLTRIMRKITTIAGAVGAKLRDRNRSVKLRLLEIGRVTRTKGAIDQDKLRWRYGQLLEATSRRELPGDWPQGT